MGRLLSRPKGLLSTETNTTQEMKLQDIIKQAHEKFDEDLSIETDIVDAQSGWITVQATVVTSKGVYSANASGAAISIDHTEERAITKALQRAGLDIKPSAPEIIIGSTVSAVEPSIFKSHIEEAGAESAQLMCSNDDDGKNPHPITAYYAGSDIMSAEQVAKRTTDKHGKPICAECSSAEVRRRSRRS